MRQTWMAWVMLVACDSGEASDTAGDEPTVTAKLEDAPKVEAPDRKPDESKATPEEGKAEEPEAYGQMSKPPPEVAPKPEPEPEPEPEAEAEADTGSGSKPRPTELAGPTPEELAAWDRKDPAAEKHLYKWDKDNFDTIDDLWEDLVCMREQMQPEGEKAFGATAGSEEDEAWFQFKRGFIVRADAWQKRMFAANPRLLEKSKFVGMILEAHEILMSTYPRAYNDSDREAIDKADAMWAVVFAKAEKYTITLGHDWPDFAADAAAEEAHRKHCEALAKVK